MRQVRQEVAAEHRGNREVGAGAWIQASAFERGIEAEEIGLELRTRLSRQVALGKHAKILGYGKAMLAGDVCIGSVREEAEMEEGRSQVGGMAGAQCHVSGNAEIDDVGKAVGIV